MKCKLEPGFGKRLREEREALGLKQDEFGEKLGVKRVTQFLYEKEESYPNYQYLIHASDLGVDVYYLFFGRRLAQDGVYLTPAILRDIYCVIDEVSVDKNGNALPLENRLGFFSVLCATYSGRNDEAINRNVINAIIGR